VPAARRAAGAPRFRPRIAWCREAGFAPISGDPGIGKKDWDCVILNSSGRKHPTGAIVGKCAASVNGD
jgi:hypothetical protein